MHQAISDTVKTLYKYRIHHLVFWVLYLLMWMTLIGPEPTWRSTFVSTFVVLFFHIALSYFNNYLLIEWFLFRRKYLAYFTGLLLSIVLTCYPLAIVSYKVITRDSDSIASIWSMQFFIYNGLFLLFTVLLSASVKLFRNWYIKEQSNNALQKLNVENELRFLKSQINPHFLFNNLNNLYALTLKHSELAPDVVLKLANILRYGLYESQKQKVLIDDDIQFVKDYIELEKLRLGDRADVHLEVNGSGFGVLIEPLLFINYIENAFKHGANPSIGKARIDINYTIDAAKQELHFKISNQIPKVLNTIEQQKVGGIGLKNVETRLNILYPGKHLLNIEQANQIYTVYLTLQLS